MSNLKDAIFKLGYKRFGTVAEILVKKLFNAEVSPDNTYDLIIDEKKVECKFSRAQKKDTVKVTEDTILEAIFQDANRDIDYDTCEFYSWDCNFQQIKKDLFDVLYYGIFFSDCLVIYSIKSEDINEEVNYSNKQHRGNVGEGQFHINARSIGLHEKNLVQILSYEEIEECLKLH